MDNDSHTTPANGASSVTVRDLLAIGFRQQRTVVVSFLVIFVAVVAFVLLGAQYEAEMKILVKRERADPVVTPGQSAQGQLWLGVTEEELNSEVELLRSRDLLAKVVVATDLHRRDIDIGTRLGQMLRGADEGASANERRIARAAEQMAEKLAIQPLRKSNVIQVRYASPDPALSAAVLNKLADHYLEKHLAVHRPSGAFAFFEHEAERYRGQLSLVQARLDQNSRQEGVVSVDVEKEATLRRVADLEALEQTTRVQIAETGERVRALETQAASTPARTTTEVRTTSGRLIEQLQGTMMPLELKRLELLRVFKPTYPSVVQVDGEIATLQQALDAAKASPVVEEATNRDPTHDYVETELAKNRSELAALVARASANAQFLSVYRERARRLAEIGVAQQTMLREAKQAEENYLVYARKREEARISDALDAQRIVNVAVAEEATLPTQPSSPRGALLLLVGTGLAGLLSVGLAFIKDYLDPSFRTPSEVQARLGLPVLASMPRSIV